jgi:hypothetical protein
MNKHQFEDLISDYIENKIKSKDKKVFENYIDVNEDARLLVDSIKSNIDTLKTLPKFKVSKEFNDNHLNLVKAENNKTKKYRPGKSFILGFNFSQFSFALILFILLSYTSYELVNELSYDKNNKNITINKNPNEELDITIESSKNSSDSSYSKESSTNNTDYSKNIKFVND